MDVYVSLDQSGYTRKPAKWTIIASKERAVQNWQEIGIGELAGLVGNKGHSMVPGHLVNGMGSKDCTEMQLFALDFDHGTSYRRIKDRCDEMGIAVAFAYHTFSSTEQEERFRIVFAYECVLKDMYVAQVIRGMLEKIFPECDKACKNLDRMFLGGKELIYVDEGARIAGVQLLLPLFKSLDSNENFKRNITAFCKHNRIAMLNNRPVIGAGEDIEEYKEIDGFMDPAIYNIHYIGEGTKPSFFIVESKKSLHPGNTCKIKPCKVSLEKPGCCRLLGDFLGGEIMPHNSRFAILTNLLAVVGGAKKFLDTIQLYYSAESYEKWENSCKYCKGYHPQKCSVDFCPYIETCEHEKTIIDTLKHDRKVYREREEELYSLAEAEGQLEANLEAAYEAWGNGIFLIKAQTAIGKTFAYINLIKNHPGDKFLVAVPTNILKEEVKKRLIAVGIPKEEIFVTPSISDRCSFIPEDIKNLISKAHERGIHNMGKKYIKEYLDQIKNDPDMPAVVEECEKLIKGEKAVGEERAIVTTHAFFLQMSDEFLRRYRVIVDEDILQLQIFRKMGSVSVACLEGLANNGMPVYSGIARQMLAAGEGIYEKINVPPYAVPLDEEQLDEIEASENDNVNDIILAGSFVKMRDEYGGLVVKYFCPQKVPDVGMVVLSATIYEDMYYRYLGGKRRIIVYPEKNAAYKGKVQQYTYHSLGRENLRNKADGVFRFAQKVAGKPDIDIITFKVAEKWHGNTNKYGIHFGNSSGIDKLKGSDIAVIGTPFSVEESYKLVACCLGADVNRKQDKSPRMRRVSHNGYSFVFVTYEEELLRRVQMYAIESELEQCVGRARLLRNDCTAYVFSSFPCQQAEIHMGNYLMEK